MSYTDILNDAGEFIKDWLDKDPLVEANSYHEKLINDIRNYKDSELPAVAVNCYIIDTDDDGMQFIRGIIEIITTGSPEQATEDCKKITIQIFESLKKKSVPGKSLLANYQACIPKTAGVNPIPLKEGFRQTGTVIFSLEMFE